MKGVRLGLSLPTPGSIFGTKIQDVIFASSVLLVKLSYTFYINNVKGKLSIHPLPVGITCSVQINTVVHLGYCSSISTSKYLVGYFLKNWVLHY